MINKTSPFKLTKGQKDAIASHLRGEISQEALARKLKLPKRQYIYHAMYALMRHMTRTKRIDVRKLLEDY